MNAATDRISRKFIGAVEDEWQLYSNNAADYTIGAPIGFGASSTVYAAQYHPADAPQPIPVALKVLDLDRLPPSALHLLRRETQLMSLSKHPNVLRVRGTWMDGHKLYIAMRLMNAGSVVDVMHYAWPGGMEEEVVKCILKQALEGLNYLHTNGLMHRDIKPANLLIDDDGTVLLGDLGVAAFLSDAEDIPPPPAFPTVQIHKRSTVAPSHLHPHPLAHQHAHGHSQPHPHAHPQHHGRHHHHHHHPHAPGLSKRKSFVGTPCYMAPEVINGRTYDASADIWSFGITALALTQGRAPRSLLSPQTALLQTVRDAPPTLDRSAGAHAYSRALQDIVASCLEKDPALRPTAQQLLATPLFRGARRKGFLVGAVLQGLPPLAERMERRRQPSVMTHGTMDSWDFDASAAGSPNASVYSWRMMGGDAEGGDADTGAKERDGRRSSAEMYVLGVRGRHGRSHSRSVPWGEDGLGNATTTDHAHPAPIAEVELPIAGEASSLSDSESSWDLHLRSSPLKATLAIPAPPLSSSPSGSSSSSSSVSASMEESAIAVPRNDAPPPLTPPPAPTRLWKKLTAKFDGDKGGRGGMGRDSAADVNRPELERRDSATSAKSERDSPVSVGLVRRKTLAMLGRSNSAQRIVSVRGVGGGGDDSSAPRR